MPPTVLAQADRARRARTATVIEIDLISTSPLGHHYYILLTGRRLQEKSMIILPALHGSGVYGE
jgi:hypothetical protein